MSFAKFMLLVSGGILMGLLMTSSAMAEDAPAPTPSPHDAKEFHPAKTEAEKKLDAVIRESEKDERMTEVLLGKDSRPSDGTPTYTAYFTPALRISIDQTQKELVKKDCGGQPEAEDDVICGIDSNPVSCTQDSDEKPYIYDTLSNDGKTAAIVYRWQDQTVPQDTATYRLVNVNNTWLIDGIDCGDVKFNVK
jgi:hypothetical protein